MRRALHTPGIVIGLGILVVIAFCAFVLPALMHLDPYTVEASARLSPSSAAHPLGTDNYGRDLLARVLAGATASLTVGASVALLSVIFGTAIGIAAVFSTALDEVLMRVCDGLMAIPSILLAVALAAALGPSTTNLITALTIVYTPGIARLVRSRALAVKSAMFVEASISAGAKPLHLLFRHLLPNTLSVITVQATFTFAESIIVEAAMSFLGAGVPAPAASWGNILYDGKAVVASAPNMIVYTSLALIITVLGLNLLGDGLRDLVDPRTRVARSKESVRTAKLANQGAVA